MAFDGIKWSDGWSSSRTFAIDVDTEVPMFPNPSDGSSIIDTTPLLDWEDVSSATEYHIQINTATDFTGAAIADDNGLTISEYPIVTVLENNKTYYWRVKIKDTDGLWGDWSSTWSFVVDMEEPVVTSPTDGSSIIDTTPLLDWGDISGITDYQVRYANSSGELTAAMVNDTTASEYLISAVQTLGSTVYWQVRAVNEDGV